MDILVTRRLTLRPPLEVDADDVALFLNNLTVSRMLGRVPFPYDRRDALDFIEKYQKDTSTERENVKFIFRERLIGAIGLEPSENAMILGYWLGESWWGNGLMKEALVAVLGDHFNRTPEMDVKADVFVDNPASLHLQESLGFEIVGAREVFSSARGLSVNTVKTRLTNARFQADVAMDPQRDAA